MSKELIQPNNIPIQLESIVEKAGIDIGTDEILAEAAILATPNAEAMANLMRRYLERFTDDDIYNIISALRYAGHSLELATDDTRRGIRNYYHTVATLEGARWYYTEGEGDIDQTARRLQSDFEFTDEVIEITPLITEIEANNSLASQAEQAENLKAKIMEMIERYQISPISDGGSDHELPVGWQSIVHARHINTPSGSSLINDNFRNAVRLVERIFRRHAIECELEKVEKMSDPEFEQLRQQYGSKAAELIRLKGYAKQIDEQQGEIEGVIKIPEFQVVSTEIYKKWLAGENIDDVLLPLFEWASKLKTYGEGTPSDYIVRSSAVNSEDGEQLTGAGIYQSVTVEGGASYDYFKAAVEAVYQSVESEAAANYRLHNGIRDERMGLVIQRLANMARSDRPIGYVNSVLPGQPSLMELVFTGEYSSITNRNFIKRETMDQYLGMIYGSSDHQQLHPAHHFKPDIHRVMASRILDEAQLAMVIEKLIGKLVQVEMVRDWPDLNVVQVRPLPPKFLEASKTVEFPQEDEIYRSSAIGIGDVQLELLPSRVDNSNRQGLVILDTNHFWTMSTDQSHRLPSEGAVLILDNSGHSGHIQTLCAERGLICLFGGQYDEDGYLVESIKGDRFRVVADGIEGRIYACDY